MPPLITSQTFDTLLAILEAHEHAGLAHVAVADDHQLHRLDGHLTHCDDGLSNY